MLARALLLLAAQAMTLSAMTVDHVRYWRAGGN